MASSRQIVTLALFALCAAIVIAAPLEESAGQDSKQTTTVTSVSSTTGAPTVGDSSTAQAKPQDSATPAATLPSADLSAYTNTSFTCYGRALGYYADMEQNCKVYHFCLLGEFNGEPIYQRVSYLCMNEKVFDQQALDCVKESELKAPCKESSSHYDISNKVLRQAVLGHDVAKTDEKSSTTTTTTTSTTTPAA